MDKQKEGETLMIPFSLNVYLLQSTNLPVSIWLVLNVLHFLAFAHTHKCDTLGRRRRCGEVALIKGLRPSRRTWSSAHRKSHKSIAHTSVNISFPFPWDNTCKQRNSDTLRLFFPNRLCFEGGKRKMRGSLWPETKVIIRFHVYPKVSLHVWPQSRTGRTQQRGTWWLFSSEMLWCASPGDTERFAPGTQRAPPAQAPEDMQGRTSSKSNHQSEVVTNLLWHLFIMQISEASFL